MAAATGAATGAAVTAFAVVAAVGAAEAAAGAVSRLVDSLTSVAALRNSLMLLPSAAPTSGSLPGPTTMSAMIRTMMSSPGPMLNGISWIDLLVDSVRHGPPRKGVRVAQRVVWPTRRRPSRGARRDRRGPVFGRLKGRPGDPPGDVDEQAAAWQARRRRRRGRARREHGRDLAALRADAGDEEGEPGRDAAHGGQLRGGGRPDHEPHGAAGSPAGRQPGDARPQRLRARRRRRRRSPRGPGPRPRPGWRCGTARRRSDPYGRGAARSPPPRGTGSR